MNKRKDENRARARMVLDTAMADYIEAARAAGHDDDGIADEIGDSLCDASNREIILQSTVIN